MEIYLHKLLQKYDSWCMTPATLIEAVKQYMERVKVWYRLFDGPGENVGLLLAGRLWGRARQIALSLRLPDPTRHVDVGDAALVRL